MHSANKFSNCRNCKRDYLLRFCGSSQSILPTLATKSGRSIFISFKALK